ncbi:hypothetical protein A946_10605 [Methylacidiphilum kamchatkense Kam1]|uniref:Uncharacterized protein n=1 Tax=Methylacidiphilum kamchatkense Kam1 TaxID=1202785 RepID=A0A0C1RSI9_9BACT|nr:hypothetical protein [Methylacidiphilum kamchatkense]KIE57896.1 hypothetical protein A946_10605 [Methylacidiphilum kamchatkense Kam1]QDQ41396.1 hypothetical protein kam1_137 [Methylacidiphilum kamchatkense Kam1]
MKELSPALLSSALEEKIRARLSELSVQLDQLVAAYLSRLHREIENLSLEISLINKHAADTRKKIKLLSQLLKTLERIQIRPEKGRRKDLKKIDSLIGYLSEQLEKESKELKVSSFVLSLERQIKQ